MTKKILCGGSPLPEHLDAEDCEFFFGPITHGSFATVVDPDATPPDTPVPDIQRIADAGVRTLFLVGERDTVAPPTVTKALQAKMTGSTLVTFDESGHSPYWEIPDQFNRVVLEFLRG